MKEERNNEIDLLLRRMGRREDGTVADGNGVSDEHLDADELSAYAENALPPAARARYMEHLSECVSCRKLATDLSLSLAAPSRTNVETVAEPSGLKKFLASLFTPMVLRYAVPALGVLVVAAVGFVVLRQQSSRDSVALRAEQPAAKTTLNKAQETATPSSPSAVTYSLDNGQRDSSEQQSGKAAAPAAKADEPKPVKEADKVSANGAPPPQASPSTVAGLYQVQPSIAGRAAEPAAAKSAPADREAEKKAEETETKQEAAAQTVQVRKEQANQAARDDLRSTTELTPGTATDQSKARNSRYESRSVAGAVHSGPRRGADEQKTEPQSNEAAKDEAETRSIAGRQFRRERGIWVDTAYDSSTATVNMTRSSEQFRALVADEPAIGTIAKQLDGEVIVVWKGRAYRIH